jgi:cyclopropane fatty-acyl-phospholipid synthase-like methyltransferase
MTETTREPQYHYLLDLERDGLSRLGLMSNAAWRKDPRRLLILMSRYKFVAKMLTGKRKAVEVGCGDCFGTRLVQQEVASVHAIDFDPVFVRDVNDRMDPQWPMTCSVHDILMGPVPGGPFDAAYSLDVLEHIPREHENVYMENVCASLEPDGVLIVGMPSIHSQAYASQPSREGHVNCKDAEALRALMSAHFQNVFLFSMNDEVVHTGFSAMAHYFLAVCAGKR